MIKCTRYPKKAQTGNSISVSPAKREGGRCEPFREQERRRPGAAGRKCPAGLRRYRKRKCASARCEFRWDHGQVLFALSRKPAQGVFCRFGPRILGGNNEEHREDHGEDRGPVQGPRLYFRRQRDLRRPGQHLGLRPPGRGAEEQREKGLVEEIRPGEPLQRGPGRRHSDEPPDLGGLAAIWAASPTR